MTKWISALFILLCAATAALAQPSLKNVERITISGSEYVRIKDWAAATGLSVSWIKRDDQLVLTNRFCKIEMKVKSIMSRFNGVDLRLSLPVINEGGGIYVSRGDVDHALHPLLFPPKNSPGEKINVICLDPGHGGKDTGKIDKLHQEKRYALLLAQEVGKLLKENGFKVIYTRTRDTTLELPDRAAIANRYNSDLFLSLHFNAASSRAVQGVETFSMTPAGVESSNSGVGRTTTGNYTGNQNNAKNMLLAYTVQRAILRGTGLEDRGMKRARFEVLRSAKMPAVLIEGGFMSNPDDARKIYDPAFRTKLAKSIVEGVLAYRSIVEASGK